MGLPYLYPASFPYGSRVVTFNFGGGGTGAAIMENIEPSEGTFEIARQNELGAPNGFALIAEPRTCSGTAQLASTSATYVSRGDTTNFAIKNGTAITWVVTQASYPEEQRGAKKQTVSLREEI